jgi:O-succinylbenzoic acid--CoA ligase
MVFGGYIDEPQASTSRLRDGWLHTGDIGAIDEDGLLRISDRRDDLIVSGGENVYPAEVESVLAAHAHVRAAAVVSAPHQRWGAVPVAFIVPAPGVVPADAELQRHCREHLAEYKVPRRFIRVEELPQDALGKVRRTVLRRRLAEMAP